MSEKVNSILLGYGIFSVGDVKVGLTRGGGSFTVEKEFREIVGDGDRGPVSGRIVLDSEVAKMKINALTIFNEDDITKYYPGLVKKENALRSEITITAADFNNIKWEGQTIDGTPVTIELENAINMGNIELSLEDKNEVITELEFTATYKEEERDNAPWSLKFGVKA